MGDMSPPKGRHLATIDEDPARMIEPQAVEAKLLGRIEPAVGNLGPINPVAILHPFAEPGVQAHVPVGNDTRVPERCLHRPRNPGGNRRYIDGAPRLLELPQMGRVSRQRPLEFGQIVCSFHAVFRSCVGRVAVGRSGSVPVARSYRPCFRAASTMAKIFSSGVSRPH